MRGSEDGGGGVGGSDGLGITFPVGGGGGERTQSGGGGGGARHVEKIVRHR